ncbi:Regulator of RpoS [Methylorubrum suomiense]|uniref:Regulator of RpoS n=1 Tax=Methylorubrum suomiense TaxID=144191 RepID=A0ABQ4UNF1_9HYPH|nr:Regulator of RpoS [Methylorubrum suomiense]
MAPIQAKAAFRAITKKCFLGTLLYSGASGTGWPDRPGPRGSGPLRAPTILVADPDEEARLALVEAVRRTAPDAVVIEAADGLDLGRLLARERIDVLFIDVALPQTNGADIARWHRSSTPQGLIVLVTDMLAPRWSSVATRLGAYEVILKPLGDHHIARVLEAARAIARRIDLLVVDHGRATRTLIRKLLEQSHFSFNILEAAGGREAVRLTERRAVDLAIIEMDLPDYPALEVACRINDRHPEARLLMMGAAMEEGMRRQLATFGASGFLRKPFHFFDVDKAVHESLGLWHPYLINAQKRDEALAAETVMPPLRQQVG